jgi:hypothetical protein
VDTARAEDIVMLWAYLTKREAKLRKHEFRFDAEIYTRDSELVAQVSSLSNSSDRMVEYLKKRFGTMRCPRLSPEPERQQQPEPQQRLLVQGEDHVQQTATFYKRKFPNDLARAVHKAARDGQARAAFELANLCDFNVRLTKYEYTPLHQAVFGSIGPDAVLNVRTAERLLTRGSAVNALDVFGRTPLYHASRRNDVDMMELLISHGANVDSVACDGSTPLHAAAEYGALEAVQKLLERGAKELGRGGCGTPMHWAARAGHYRVLGALIAKNFDVNVVDWYRSTPLHMAARLEQGKDALRVLLAYSADRDAVDADGRTALHVALAYGSPQGVQVLSTGVQDIPVVQKTVDTDLELQKQRFFWNEMTAAEVAAFAETNPERELSWMDWLVRTKTYVKTHGTLPCTPELGWWSTFQAYRKSFLNAWQIRELESLPQWRWKSPLDRKLGRVMWYLRLQMYVSKKKNLHAFESWRSMILTWKAQHGLSEATQRAIDFLGYDDFWDTTEPQSEPQPRVVSTARETLPALEVIKSIQDPDDMVQCLERHLSSELRTANDVKPCFDLWRECRLDAPSEMPRKPTNGVYILNKLSRRSDGHVWNRESRQTLKSNGTANGMMCLYATSTDNTLKRKVFIETECPPQCTPLMMVKYTPIPISSMDILAQAASDPMEDVEDDFQFLQSVPKKQRTQSHGMSEATLAAPSKEIAQVAAAAGETVTSDTEVSGKVREVLAATSTDTPLAMGMALKALYDNGIGGSDMRWAASHVLGKKLSAEEKKYLFESVRDYVLQGKLEEAVEWVKDIKGAVDF